MNFSRHIITDDGRYLWMGSDHRKDGPISIDFFGHEEYGFMNFSDGTVNGHVCWIDIYQNGTVRYQDSQDLNPKDIWKELEGTE